MRGSKHIIRCGVPLGSWRGVALLLSSVTMLASGCASGVKSAAPSKPAFLWPPVRSDDERPKDKVGPAVGAERNVLGGQLKPCSERKPTGFYSDGLCSVGRQDYRMQLVCARLTSTYLRYARRRPRAARVLAPLRGSRVGDHLCLGAIGWREAFDAGFGPPVILEATHVSALSIVPVAKLTRNRLRRQ